MTDESAVSAIIEEFVRATRTSGPFSSAHEGYAVILEELDELWEEIRKRNVDRDMIKMRKEAVQVGAMALRFLVDCIPEEAKG